MYSLSMLLDDYTSLACLRPLSQAVSSLGSAGAGGGSGDGDR